MDFSGELVTGLNNDNELHVWIAYPDLITDPQLLHAYHAVMTPQEAQRQQKFYFERDRHQALVTRGLVRSILGHYVQQAPGELSFSIGERGKPELSHAFPLRFNLSHTHGVIMLGVIKENSLGVDVESTGRVSNAVDIADHFFSPSEVSTLRQQPQLLQNEQFYEYWTLKEAYIKACGQGLAIPLDKFSFDLSRKPDIDIGFANDWDDSPDQWMFWLYQLSENVRMAIALQRPEHRPNVRFFEVVPMSFFKEINIEPMQ